MTPEGDKFSPWLRSPLRDYQITEGWTYSEEETAAHGAVDHQALDFAAPIGTPVYAAADGLAYGTYHFRYVFEDKERTRIRRSQDKTVACSLGHHVVILHLKPALPARWLYTIYGHLSAIADGIPVIPVERFENGLDVVWKSPIDFGRGVDHHEFMRPVKQGDVIGYIGISGMEWGDEGSPTLAYKAENYWDEPHTHFALQVRDTEGEHLRNIDPFLIYGDNAAYIGLKAERRGFWL